MAVSLKHKFASLKSDGPDTTIVQPSNWNAEHDLLCAAGNVLGNPPGGGGTAVLEIPLGATGKDLMATATPAAARTALGAVNIAGDTMTGTLALPANGLDVGAGQLRVTGGNVTASGNITATGNVTAYSDARLKTDVERIANALGMVQAMRGVRYRRIADEAPGVGVIAQELNEVVPELIAVDENGMMSVAYANLVAVLIEAVKELAYRVDELEDRE